MRAALILSIAILFSACGPFLAPTAAVPPGAEADTRAASPPRIAPPPVAPPTPPGTNLPAFSCVDGHGGKTGVANVTTARVGQQPGFDRFVLQFDSFVPSYTVKRQSAPLFTFGGSGQPVTLSGTAGALVRVHSATGANTFAGSTDLSHGEYPVLKEARQTEDFEGYVGWALGLSKEACLRTFTLTDPARLVVDFSTASS